MTNDERRQQLRAEADEATAAFAAQLASEEKQTSGIPKPPEITVTQTETDVERFGLLEGPQEHVDPAAATQGPPGPPCSPCNARHLSIHFRFAGSIQTDGCFPNSDHLSWDCGFGTTAAPVEVDILPCSTTFIANLQRDFTECGSSCGSSGDPSTCNWHAGVSLSLVGGHTLRSSYGSNNYYAFIGTTRNCSGTPTAVTASYDATVDGYPPLPADIVVPDWCAAVGTLVFGYNGFWTPYYSQGGCDCFGGPKNIILGFGLYLYIDVT